MRMGEMLKVQEIHDELMEQMAAKDAEIARLQGEVVKWQIAAGKFAAGCPICDEVGEKNERLRLWAKDEQQKREKVEEQRTEARSEIERLRAGLEKIIAHLDDESPFLAQSTAQVLLDEQSTRES